VPRGVRFENIVKMEPLKGIVALDPGALTFMSLFSNEGYSEVGNLLSKRQSTKRPNPTMGPKKKRKRWRIPKLPTPPVTNPPPNLPSKEHLVRVRKRKNKSSANRLSGPLLVNAYRIQTLQSEIDRSKGKEKGQPGHLPAKKIQNRREKIKELWDRIVRIVDDVHRKLISKMIKTYALILIPKFNVSSMVRRGTHRVIGKKSVSNLMRWAHYRFRTRLIQAAKYTACSVMVVNEAYTSKTCTGCGNLNESLGGNRVFRCNHCNIELPRDANGARNILIRFLLRFVKGYKFHSKFQKSTVNIPVLGIIFLIINVDPISRAGDPA
jgi:transposase